jgi:hypothetical protein
MPSGDAKAAALIDRLRRIALALDGASEKLSHGEPTFFVRGRVFAMIDDHHHGADRVAVYCNAPDGVQRALVEGDPEHFFVPPYVGKAGWVGVRLDCTLPWDVIGEVVERAHALTGVKKKRRAL